MRLPSPDRAVVDIAKLTDYCLDPTHLRGRHKARGFSAVLGMTQAHAWALRAALLEAAQDSEAQFTGEDDYGQRFVVDFFMEGPAGEGQIRSCWIIRSGEDFPRLTSCFVL